MIDALVQQHQHMKEVMVLYSGGLDSRLTCRLLTEKGYTVEAAFFRLPFSAQHPDRDGFLEEEAIPLHIFDANKGHLLDDYLEALDSPVYGRGKGFNPCLDCKIFMMRHLGGYSLEKGFDAIATGEVPGQRPMSQTSRKMQIIQEESPLPVIRPLAELGIQGRSRKHQLELARRFHIDYPMPAGGCLLCEKDLKVRFQTLFRHKLVGETTLPLITLGRHFYDPQRHHWFVVGRNQSENTVIEQYQNVVPSDKGQPAVYHHSNDDPEKAREQAHRLQKAYRDRDTQAIESYYPWKL